MNKTGWYAVGILVAYLALCMGLGWLLGWVVA